MKTNSKIVAALICMASVFGCHSLSTDKLVIASSSNLHGCIPKIVKSFTKETGIACDIVMQSSGMLTAQIQEGAPFDVFISADVKYPHELFTKGLTHESPIVYGRGSLVLWSMVDGIEVSMDNLVSSNIKHIAIPNPKVAPYGEAAIEILQNMQLLESIKDKLVYGESISQVNQFIISKSAEIGISSKSSVINASLDPKGSWIDLDTKKYAPIDQGMVRLKRTNQNETNSKKFIDYLLSDDGKELLSQYGYEVDGL